MAEGVFSEGRLAADLGYLIAVGVLRSDIKLVHADSSVPEWSAP